MPGDIQVVDSGVVVEAPLSGFSDCENVRAKLREIVKPVLKKYGFPPDKRQKATQIILEPAEALSAERASAA